MVQEPVELAQEFRKFDLTAPWEQFPKFRESCLFGLATMYVCSENDFHYRNAQESRDARDEIENGQFEMVSLLSTRTTSEGETGKNQSRFELCHIIFDASSFVITLALTISGAICIDAEIDEVLFIIVITEMQLFGLILA